MSLKFLLIEKCVNLVHMEEQDMTTLTEIVEIIRRDTGIREIDVNVITRQVFEVMKQILEAGDEISISDFGLFSIRRKSERVVNFLGQERITIPAHGVVHFKPYGTLKEMAWDMVDDEKD